MMNGTDKKKENWFAERENILSLIELPFKTFNFLILASTTLWILYLSNSMQNEGIANSITNLLAKYWVKPILSKIESGSIPIGIIILFAVLIIIFFIGKGIRRYVYSGKTVTIYSVIILNYSLLRLFDTPYNFSNLSNNGSLSNIAYWDVFFLLFIPIIYHISGANSYKSKKTKSSVSVKSPYLSDDPVKKDEDIFPERISIAEKFSDSIKVIQAKSSYAIGITSPWGNGKTTFLSYLLKKLKEKDNKAIFIEFSPWFCKTEADIIYLFFDSLSNGLKGYHSSIKNQLQKYAKIILSLRKNTLTESIGKALNLFEESKELHSIYKELNKHIGNLNRKIYISIDDLDRLYAKEIIECFKIIRNTANFKNIVFIVAYDVEYVDKALKEALKENHRNYIDKIIQLEYALPEVESSALVQFIETKLETYGINEAEIKKILSPEYIERVQSQNNGQRKLSKLKFEDYFSNVRDCIRILNSFFSQYQNLGEEVLPSDLFLVCMLKTLYPDEALKLYLNLNEYFTDNNALQFKDLDQLKNYAIKQKDRPAKTEPRYLIRELNVDENFMNLIQAIFFKPEPSIPSVSFNDNFETYYNGVVPERKVRNIDFSEWIKSPENLINNIKKINSDNKFVIQEKLDDLALKLVRFKPQDKIQAQIILQGIFYLDRNLNTVISLLFSFKDDYYDIIYHVINNDLDMPLKGIARKLSDIKFRIIDSEPDSDYKRVFEFEKIQDLSLKLLEKKIATELIDTELLDIYWNCAIERTGESIKIDIKANELMKECAEANAIEFIKILEIIPHHVRDNETRAFHYSVDQIFSNEIGNYDEFDKFFKNVVMDNPNNSELERIWEYWIQYKVSDYRYYHIE